MDLMWRSSYDSVGVGEICRQSKAHKGSFYHFFHSKEELAVEALEEHWSSTLPTLKAIFASEQDPKDQFLRFCDYTLNQQEEKKAQFGFICGCPYTTVGLEQCAQSQAIRETSLKILGQIKQFFTESLQEDSKANEFFTFYLGALSQARLSNDLEPIQQMKGYFASRLNTEVFA